MLDGCISNAGCIKALTEADESDRLMGFFKLELTSKINFGRAQCLQNSASKFNTQIDAELMTVSRKIQADTGEARKEALSVAVEQLSTCTNRSVEFGREEWVRQCQNAGSAVNVLDQLYAVQREEVYKTPDEEASEHNELSAEMEQDSPKIFKMSSFLYALAIHDSKEIVNAHIRKKRVNQESARRRAATARDKQAQVDLVAPPLNLLIPSDAGSKL